MSKKNNKMTVARVGNVELEKVTSENRGVPLFQARSAVQTPQNVVVKSMAPVMKPTQWPLIDGEPAILVGKFEKLVKLGEFVRKVNGKNETVQGVGAVIVPKGHPVGVCLPVTAILRTGLDVKGDGEDATSPFLNRTVQVELLGKVPSKKGQDAWNFLVAIYPEGQ